MTGRNINSHVKRMPNLIEQKEIHREKAPRIKKVAYHEIMSWSVTVLARLANMSEGVNTMKTICKSNNTKKHTHNSIILNIENSL